MTLIKVALSGSYSRWQLCRCLVEDKQSSQQVRRVTSWKLDPATNRKVTNKVLELTNFNLSDQSLKLEVCAEKKAIARTGR